MSNPASRAGERGAGAGSAGAVPGPGFPRAGGTPSEQIEHRHVREGGHPHGKPASWVLVGVVIAAFATGGVALITHAWWLVWTCTGIIVLAIPAGKVVGIMNDTVGWDSPPPAAHDSAQAQGADPPRDQRAPRKANPPDHLSARASRRPARHTLRRPSIACADPEDGGQAGGLT